MAGGKDMDTIIQELISYDRQAREILQGAVQAKEQAEKELPAEEEKLYHDFLQRAKERTDRIQEQMAGSLTKVASYSCNLGQLCDKMDKIRGCFENKG